MAQRIIYACGGDEEKEEFYLVICIQGPCPREILQIYHLQGGVVAAGEDNFIVDINTFHSFIVQLLFPYFCQSVEVPDLDRRFILTCLVLKLT